MNKHLVFTFFAIIVLNSSAYGEQRTCADLSDAKEYAAALVVCRKAAEAGDPDAQNRMGNMYVDGTGVKKDETIAEAWYRKAEKQGFPKAEANLGMLFRERGDFSHALKYFRSASDKGLAQGFHGLGSLYFYGYGVPVDKAKAFAYYSKAAELGLGVSQVVVGALYYQGDGVERDIKKAAEFLRNGAEKGELEAAFILGLIYEEGELGKKDLVQAVKWYRKAADGGHTDAMTNLGLILLTGEDTISKDEESAFKLFSQAAEKGNVKAQRQVGYCYYAGSGVDKDTARAFEWSLKAALTGNSDAQNDLAILWQIGFGETPSDYVRALKWYILAEKGGSTDAKTNGENLRKHMEKNDIAIATRAALYFRTPVSKADPKKNKKWLTEYRARFKAARTLDDWKGFAVSYEYDDPDNLMPKAGEKALALIEKSEKAKETKLKARIRAFQGNLKVGDTAVQGLVIEIKRPIVKVQTYLGEHWYNIKELMPLGIYDKE